MMDRQPTLEGPTLLLRPLVPGDHAALYAVARDPLVWALHPRSNRWEAPVFRAYFDKLLASKSALTVIDKATAAPIGASRYDLAEVGPGDIEIGSTFISLSHWGGQTNAELKQLMLAHAFASVEHVMFRVGETNWRSRRAMEKIGGQLSTRWRESDGVMHVIYTIDRASFAAGPLAEGG